nr:MAG TPA: hypothetical protein [Caudoviricetes sp.]
MLSISIKQRMIYNKTEIKEVQANEFSRVKGGL